MGGPLGPLADPQAASLWVNLAALMLQETLLAPSIQCSHGIFERKFPSFLASGSFSFQSLARWKSSEFSPLILAFPEASLCLAIVPAFTQMGIFFANYAVRKRFGRGANEQQDVQLRSAEG